jgi:hypothetical protein
MMMSHLRVLICRVEETDEQLTEVDRLDLPPGRPEIGVGLDTRQAQVATVGQRLLGRLVERQWEEIDAQLVARYRARHAPGRVVADGWAPLLVASRFGTLELHRQVLAHRDGRPHCMPGNDVLPAHEGLVITRGLEEQACLLCQDLPFATAARLLGWQIREPKILSASTLRTLVRRHGTHIRRHEQGEATYLLSTGTRGQRLRGVPVGRPRRHPGWPTTLSAASTAALRDGRRRPPEGVSQSDWDRVRAARAADPTLPLTTLQRLGPTLAPGEMFLVLDEVLTRAREQDQFHELRTACLLTAEGRRYLSGRGPGFLRQARAAVQACCARSLLVVGDGASWIRTFFQDQLAAFPQAEMLLDWYHLAKKCRELAARICPEQDRRRLLVRRVLRALWGGHVPRAVRVLRRCRRQAADRAAVDTLCTYLEARSAWIPD